MTDFYPQEDDAGFWENMGLDNQAASEEETPAESAVEAEAPAEEADTAEEEASAERARDEKGRFVAAESEAEQEDSPAEKLYAGKYKSVEELERAYSEAEKKIGSQGSEMSDLRKAVEDLRSSFEEDDDDYQETNYDPNTLRDWFEENPSQIPQVAITAHQQGNTNLRDQALVAWEELDPISARHYEREFLKDELRREQQQHVQSQNEMRTLTADVAREFATNHPDMDALAPAMREIAAQYPQMARILQSNDRSAQLEYLDFLYTKARGRQADTLSQATKEVETQQAEEVDRAIAEAQVASGKTAKPEPPALTAADRIGAEWDAIEKPFADGWNLGR